MRLISALVLCFLATVMSLAQDQPRAPHVPNHREHFKALEFLAGEFTGSGQNPLGKYSESMKAGWEVNDTTLTVRSTSVMAGKVVFEDLRVFSFDNDKQVLRMRQWALGDMITYDVKVEADNVTCTEIAHEGKGRGEWRYTFTRQKFGFDYKVEEKRDGKFGPYVSGTLVPSPAARGSHEVGNSSTQIPIEGARRMEASLFYPKTEGLFPTIVFSPGGQAATTAGYDGFARWFAGWGFICVVVAFDTADADSRAGLYGKVADWLVEFNKDERSGLKGKIDTAKLVAAGHSRGGAAALLACARDKRFAHCVALAPSGPESWESENKPAVFLAVGTDDDLLFTSTGLYEKLQGPRHIVKVDGMNHFLQPGDKTMHVVSRATAFLLYRVGGNAAYAGWVTDSAPGVEVESAG